MVVPQSAPTTAKPSTGFLRGRVSLLSAQGTSAHAQSRTRARRMTFRINDAVRFHPSLSLPLSHSLSPSAFLMPFTASAHSALIAREVPLSLSLSLSLAISLLRYQATSSHCDDDDNDDNDRIHQQHLLDLRRNSISTVRIKSSNLPTYPDEKGIVCQTLQP